MKKIGILSDTHGCWDDRYATYFADCDEVWHAGDIGCVDVIRRLEEVCPVVRAVHGNIDYGETRRYFPSVQQFRVEETNVFMTHIGGYPRHYDPRAVQKIQSVHPKLFIAGHSHILKVIYDPVYDLLHVNPGAAGEFGFHKVRTAVRLTIDGAEMRDMEVGEWPRC